MQIEVRPGRLYFLKGKEEGRVRDIVAGLRSNGYRLLVVSARVPGAIMDDMGVPMDNILTLTESVGPHFVDPENLMVLTDTMIKFIERDGPAALLLEDLSLLRQKNEFPKVLQMIGYVYESVALNRGVGIVVIDSQSWNSRELAFLGKEGSMVEEKDRLDMKALKPQDIKDRQTQNV